MRTPLDCWLPPERVLLALRGERLPFALIGAWAGGGAIIGCNPVRELDGGDPFAALDAVPAAEGDAEVGGGWFGWLGYGLGSLVEDLPPPPPRPVPLPAAQLAFYDHVLRQDARGEWWFESLAAADDAADARLARLRALLEAAPAPVPPAPAHFSLRGAGHLFGVRECVERIAAGEIFQANLCTRLEAAWDGDVAELFAAAVPQLRPDYAACFITPNGSIASLSPELFLRRRGRDVMTGPIKGTAPRDPAKLRASAKDRAEHVMIVDLMRNDLGRVAEYGSVVAADDPEPRAQAGVYHLVSEVHARLREGVGDADLLRATFPPGSVTGAPKIQAMHVISDLESTGREVYTGAIGFASPHAGLELSVAIRTFEHHRGHLWLGAGGGIVADSQPEAELEECLVKARPLLAAIGGSINLKGTVPLTFPLGSVWRAAADLGPRLASAANLKGTVPFRRPDAARGVFTTLRPGVNQAAHLARLAASVRELYGVELPDVAVPDFDGAVRIEYVPGTGVTVMTRPAKPRALPIVLTPYVLPGGLGAHKWIDRDVIEKLSEDGTTPLLLDADGTLLEAAWAAVLVKRGGVLYTPKRDGRILPSTSVPPALERDDLTLEPGDELFVSSALAGLVPAVLRTPGSP